MSEQSAGMATAELALHHEDHRHLLDVIPTRRKNRADIDAVILPTSRHVAFLEDALKLAQSLKCGLVAMCSGDISASDAAAAATEAGVPAVAVNVANLTHKLPEFTTTGLVAKSSFGRSADTSAKRNMAMLLARVSGWQRVLYLDDDIFDVSPDGIRAAAWLIDKYDAVGIRNYGFPDNSVVCHVNRLVGYQTQFVGAGALIVSPQRSRSYFPQIYNEDWFFIIGHGRVRVAATGKMWQSAYDPFSEPDRARREEFGDCLAEGLYWLLDDHKSIEAADEAHWDAFLSRRSLFIRNLVDKVEASGWVPFRRERVLASLAVAYQTTERIDSELCVEFLQRWRTDLEIWREFLALFPIFSDVYEALSHLEWPDVVMSNHPWPVARVDGLAAPAEDLLGCAHGRADSEEDSAAGRTSDSTSEPSQLAPTPA